jgi:hypothetical protein
MSVTEGIDFHPLLAVGQTTEGVYVQDCATDFLSDKRAPRKWTVIWHQPLKIASGYEFLLNLDHETLLVAFFL